jgi:hypothetical protein
MGLVGTTSLAREHDDGDMRARGARTASKWPAESGSCGSWASRQGSLLQRVEQAARDGRAAKCRRIVECLDRERPARGRDHHTNERGVPVRTVVRVPRKVCCERPRASRLEQVAPHSCGRLRVVAVPPLAVAPAHHQPRVGRRRELGLAPPRPDPERVGWDPRVSVYRPVRGQQIDGFWIPQPQQRQEQLGSPPPLFDGVLVFRQLHPQQFTHRRTRRLVRLRHCEVSRQQFGHESEVDPVRADQCDDRRRRVGMCRACNGLKQRIVRLIRRLHRGCRHQRRERRRWQGLLFGEPRREPSQMVWFPRERFDDRAGIGSRCVLRDPVGWEEVASDVTESRSRQNRIERRSRPTVRQVMADHLREQVRTGLRRATRSNQLLP